MRRTDDTVKFAFTGESRQLQHAVGSGSGMADLAQVGIRETGQHRYTDQQRRLAAHRCGGRINCAARRLQHRPPAARVNIEHEDAKLRSGGAGAGHGIGNVMKFEIEKYTEAAIHHPADGFRTADHEQLLAYLEAALLRIEPIGEPQGSKRIGEVEGDEDARRGAWRCAHAGS